jgi:hypothetical protein
MISEKEQWFGMETIKLIICHTQFSPKVLSQYAEIFKPLLSELLLP